MEEQWKDIVIEKNGEVFDYTGLYQVSNLGRIRSLDRVDSLGRRLKGKIMKLTVEKSGYIIVGLSKECKVKNFKVHRLVATMFIPNPENYPVVNHRDENPSNNCVDNLEWCTQKYNTNYGTIRERKSEKLKGKPKSEESKRKMSEAKKGKPGRHHTEEERRNLSERMAGDKNPMSRKVICLETKQIFTTMKDAGEWCRGDVRKCCRGKQKTAGGLHWQYYEDYKRQLRMNTDIKNSQLVA